MTDVLQSGNLASGPAWELLVSRESAVTEGQHLQLVFADGRDKCSSNLEIAEMYILAEHLASELAYSDEKGRARFRIARNGPGQASRQSFHIHIILPAGDDYLPRLVVPVELPT